VAGANHPAGVVFAAVEAGWVGFFALAVRPEFRRRGVGSALMVHLLRWASRSGAAHCYLEVDEGSDAAAALYARLGFAPWYPYHYRREPWP
jgi:GNAT superfamily N-acetyltransferase